MVRSCRGLPFWYLMTYRFVTYGQYTILLPIFQAPHCNKLSTLELDWLAWASMAWTACRRMLFLVNSVISLAMSASRMVDSEAWTFWLEMTFSVNYEVPQHTSILPKLTYRLPIF